MNYLNYLKFSDGYARANSADPDQTLHLEEQSNQGLHCSQQIFVLNISLVKFLCLNFVVIITHTASLAERRRLDIYLLSICQLDYQIHCIKCENLLHCKRFSHFFNKK